MAKKVAKVVDIKSLLLEYDQLREREKAIKKRKEEVAKFIKEYATDNGVKDQNGSYYSETDDYVFGNQARKSVKLNEDKAKQFFKEKGLYAEVIDIKEVINEDKVEQILAEEKITVDDIEAISEIKVTYAIDIKPKESEEESPEEMPEVQVSNSTKRKLPIRKRG